MGIFDHIDPTHVSEEKTPEKPLIHAEELTDAEKFDPMRHRGALDPSRIPGYSEVVQANDIDKADDLEFRKANGITKEEAYRLVGATPRKLSVEFKWLPISGVAGGELSPIQARVMDRYVNQEGFRLATIEDLTSNDFGFPPLGRTAEDGTIRRGADVALYVRSGEVARKWEAFKIAEQAALEGRSLRELDVDPEAGAYGRLEDSETVYVKH